MPLRVELKGNRGGVGDVLRWIFDTSILILMLYQ
jgi:hypothetical protein